MDYLFKFDKKVHLIDSSDKENKDEDGPDSIPYDTLYKWSNFEKANTKSI